MRLATDEAGNVVSTRIDGFDEMPHVKQCIASATRVRIDGVDAGDAWADVQLAFRFE